ncbi:MAG: 2-phospho-L-lactate transferase, partial [Acidimicrobiaceae bacterium]|nr:2-phospho-L-lactate transferase [Acidimicrobiaceae bacterium]
PPSRGVSVGRVLAVGRGPEARPARRDRNGGGSPIVAGAALRGPAARMLRELGEESSVVGVARRYRDVAGTLVIDEADSDLAPAVAEAGVRPVVAPTIMSSPEAAAELARRTMAAVLP